MTGLERSCRLLLRAYPAEYRRDRGEEILGTLLEATPEGRAWPLARDVRGLVVGGLRARAALNQQRTTAANLRTAALIGATAYLAFTAVSDVSWAVRVLALPAIRADFPVWQPLLAGTTVLAAVALAWVSTRRALTLAGAIAASAAFAVSLIPDWPRGIALMVVNFACLAALALFAGRDGRPTRTWLWAVALFAAVPVLNYLLPGVWVTLFLYLLAVLAGVSLLWVAVDARPAVALSVFVLAILLPPQFATLYEGPGNGVLVPLLVVIPLAAGAVWLLRRQSAQATLRRASPTP